MIKNKTHLFNKIFIESGRLSHHQFISDVNKIEEVQHKKLIHYLSANSSTSYGEKFNFKKINNYASYALQVPIIEDWEQIKDYISQIEKGEQHILCSDKITAFEETSGTSGFSKLIPYNKALRKEFQKAIQVWMFSLYKLAPQAFHGKSYWSLSPALKETRHTEGGIKIGLENDSDYFDPFTAYLLSQLFAVDASVKKIKETEAFYYETLIQLLLQRDLSFISFWSPTFFLQMDKFLREHRDSLLADIFRIDKKRFTEIREIIMKDFNWKELWPGLSCISCWADGQSSLWISHIKKIAGDVFIQPKGLLSTEAVVSIPIMKQPFPALAYHSHFFEFRNTTNKKIVLAHQLIKEESYEVILTTAGGLYRYATKDIIQVKGFYHQLPLLKFLGRSNRTSDIVGEKLSEVQVNSILERAFSTEKIKITTMFLKPIVNNNSGHYMLYIESEEPINEKLLDNLTKRIDKSLCENPYYKQAIDIGQLKPLQSTLLNIGFTEKLKVYFREKKMIKDGNLKLPLLFLVDELKEFNNLL